MSTKIAAQLIIQRARRLSKLKEAVRCAREALDDAVLWYNECSSIEAPPIARASLEIHTSG